MKIRNNFNISYLYGISMLLVTFKCFNYFSRYELTFPNVYHIILNKLFSRDSKTILQSKNNNLFKRSFGFDNLPYEIQIKILGEITSNINSYASVCRTWHKYIMSLDNNMVFLDYSFNYNYWTKLVDFNLKYILSIRKNLELEFKILYFGKSISQVQYNDYENSMIIVTSSGKVFYIDDDLIRPVGFGNIFQNSFDNIYPLKISSSIKIRSISCSDNIYKSLIMISTIGDVYVCGSNSMGQLGIDLNNNGSLITEIKKPTKIILPNNNQASDVYCTRDEFSYIYTTSGEVLASGKLSCHPIFMTSIEYKVRKNTLRLRYLNDLEYVIYLFTPISFKPRESVKEIGEMNLFIKNCELKDEDLNKFTYILTKNNELYINKQCIAKEIGRLSLFHRQNLYEDTFIQLKIGDNFKIKKIIDPWYILTNNGKIYELSDIYKYINFYNEYSIPEVNIISFGKKVKNIYTLNGKLIGLFDDNKIYKFEYVNNSFIINLKKNL